MWKRVTLIAQNLTSFPIGSRIEIVALLRASGRVKHVSALRTNSHRAATRGGARSLANRCIAFAELSMHCRNDPLSCSKVRTAELNSWRSSSNGNRQRKRYLISDALAIKTSPHFAWALASLARERVCVCGIKRPFLVKPFLCPNSCTSGIVLWHRTIY